MMKYLNLVVPSSMGAIEINPNSILDHMNTRSLLANPKQVLKKIIG